MSDPDRFVSTQRVKQFQHVADDGFLRVVFISVVHAGTPVAAHVWCNSAKAQRPQRGQLRFTPNTAST